MFKDNPKKVIERILKDKDKQYLEFEYRGETNKDKKTPHGRGHKEFKLDYKSGIYYDLENLLCSSHMDTQEYFLELGIRDSESSEYKNGIRHGSTEMHMMEYRTGDVTNKFYCTFKNGVPHGYALNEGIYDSNFREHLVLYFDKGKILHYFWNYDKSRAKYLKKLEKNDDYIFNIVSGLEVFFYDESYRNPKENRSYTHKDFKL